jgi:hypothetical protein
MRKIKQLRIEDSIPYPYEGIETVELGLDLEPRRELSIVALKLLPHSKASGKKGPQCYDEGDYVRVRVSFLGGFTSTGEQCVVNNFVPPNSPVAQGPLLQGTAGYLKVNTNQLATIMEVFNREDYLGVKGWSNDVFVGVDSKGELMLVMNIDREDIQLVAIPGTNTIPPFPKGDGRTTVYKQRTYGVKSPLPAPVKKYTHQYVTDADMDPKYVHQPGDKLGF